MRIVHRTVAAVVAVGSLYIAWEHRHDNDPKPDPAPTVVNVYAGTPDKPGAKVEVVQTSGPVKVSAKGRNVGD